MIEINQRGRYGKYHLPKNWYAVESDGKMLYAMRVCSRYFAMFECGEWHGYHDHLGFAPITGKLVGKGATIDHALISCREHMYNTSA